MAAIPDHWRVAGKLLSNVNPIFDWVQFAQRMPLRIRIDASPDGSA